MGFPTPEAAEAAFYAAFEARSLDAMMAVWAADEAVACIHPLAAPLNGRAAVTAGWRSLFDAAGQFRIQVELAHEIREAAQVIRIVREYLVIGHETEPRPPILATNVYRREADGWRMVLHHASPLQVGGAPPARTPPVVLH
jgi:ketosteroid isomerase-like protein